MPIKSCRYLFCLVALFSTVAYPATLVNIQPQELRFATQSIDTISSPLNVVISNTGDTSFTIKSINISSEYSLGKGNECFTDGSSCASTPTPLCGTIAPGAACTLNIWYLPKTSPGKTGTLRITTDATTTDIIAVSLVGRTAAVNCPAIVRAKQAFPDTPVSSISTPITITLNSGSSPRRLAISTSGDFRQINDCDQTLAANSTCDIEVSFAPTANGDRSGVLAFDEDDVCEIDGRVLQGKATGNPAQPPASVGTPANPTAPTATTTTDTTTDVKGCTIGSGGAFDPVLLLVVMGAMLRLYRNKNTA